MRTIALLLAVAALLGWLLLHHEPDLPPALRAEALGKGEPRYAFEGLAVQRTDSAGAPAVRLTMARAEYFDDRSALLREIDAEGLSGAAAPWRLHSGLGEVPPREVLADNADAAARARSKARRLQLHAPVTGFGRFPDGEQVTVEAGDVWVEETARRFVSKEPVRLEGATKLARAEGFTAGFDGTTLKLDSVEMRYALRR